MSLCTAERSRPGMPTSPPSNGTYSTASTGGEQPPLPSNPHIAATPILCRSPCLSRDSTTLPYRGSLGPRGSSRLLYMHRPYIGDLHSTHVQFFCVCNWKWENMSGYVRLPTSARRYRGELHC